MAALPSIEMREAPQRLRSEITTIHTLGPSGTNCERAAQEWFSRRGYSGAIRLHSTLEVAVEVLCGERGAALLGCVVYPNLHTLVFSNLHRLELVDCFIMPTYNMVLAARRDVEAIKSVATHPAPAGLVPQSIPERRLVHSNTQAAIDCASGLTDACITTIVTVEPHGLRIIQDFGPVPMGFTVHAQIKQPTWI